MALGHSTAGLDGAGRQAEFESHGTAKGHSADAPQNSHGARARGENTCPHDPNTAIGTPKEGQPWRWVLAQPVWTVLAAKPNLSLMGLHKAIRLMRLKMATVREPAEKIHAPMFQTQPMAPQKRGNHGVGS